MSSQFNVISLFSGCGGSSLGYQLAGGKILLAVEIDNNAVKTYKSNFPDTKVYHGDIHRLTVEKVFQLTGLHKGELDILDGSPPCQGFSMTGKRNFCDPRNQLYKDYIRFLRGLQPKTFVMENVSGLLMGKMKLIFADMIRELKGSGYQVKARLMNAMYYNVPQSRKRIIFIGVREDLDIVPTFPKPQSRPMAVKEVIQHLEKKEGHITPLMHKRWFKTKIGEPIGKFNLEMKLDPNKPCPTLCKSNRRYHYKYPRELNEDELKVLASYPSDFKFLSRISARERIGNSVPPNFMKAIAEHIQKNILLSKSVDGGG
jgi:DNA (cytosine-5)-methyltransferase 1